MLHRDSKIGKTRRQIPVLERVCIVRINMAKQAHEPNNEVILAQCASTKFAEIIFILIEFAKTEGGFH
jgi:hypothetical protein